LKHPSSTLLGAGLLSFFVFLLASFPARVAYRWFAPANLQISGLEGSIWNGSASEMSVFGIDLLSPGWRMKPHYVVLGKLAYSIEGSAGSGFINTDVAVSFGGTVTMTDLTGSLPLHFLEKTVSLPGLAGNATLRFKRLQFVDGLPVAADGFVEVLDLMIPVIHQSSIGGYRVEFFTQQDEVVASVEDTDGVVDLAGSLRIAADRSYRFLGRVASKPETPDNMRQQMRLLGSVDARGQYELRLEGQL
jgi:general secretion pathway protein N